MPAFSNNPFATVPLAVRGVPTYLFGSYNMRQANTRMLVSNVALTTNVATLTVLITEGEIPLVGSLVSVQQTQSTSGLFNVNRVPLTAVSITAATGAGTISFALTNANVTSAADTGSSIAEVPEIGEAITAIASQACCLQPPPGLDQFTVATAVTFTTLPTAVTVVLQRAIRNVNAEFTTIGNAAVVAASAYTTAGPVAEFTLEGAYFYRFLVSGLTLGSGAGLVAKIG